MSFSKADLFYTDYSWVDFNSDNPKISGHPDDTLFDKSKGREMLYLIHTFNWGGLPPSYEQGRKIERMIHDHLPSNIRTQ